MILAIWLHEYAHGTAGHANYWSAVYGASPLSEIDETPAYSSLTKEVAERQLFEGVADEGATSLMLAPFMLEWRAEQFVTDRAFDMTEWAVFRLLAIMMVQFLWCQMDRFFNGRDLLRLDSGGVYPISSSRLFAQILVVKRLGDIKQLRFEELSPALARALAELGVIASLHPQFAFIDRMLQPEKVRDFVNYVNEVARIADWREKKLKYQYSAIA